jgi:hypothetical protein
MDMNDGGQVLGLLHACCHEHPICQSASELVCKIFSYSKHEADTICEYVYLCHLLLFVSVTLELCIW